MAVAADAADAADAAGGRGDEACASARTADRGREAADEAARRVLEKRDGLEVLGVEEGRDRARHQEEADWRRGHEADGEEQHRVEPRDEGFGLLQSQALSRQHVVFGPCDTGARWW